LDYLKKASRAAAGPIEVQKQYLAKMTWDQLTTEFVNKFYEQFWYTLGDRPWADHHDFHLAIAEGIKYFCPPPGLDEVPTDVFHAKINAAVAWAYDNGRYYYLSRDVIKKCVRNKDHQWIVRESLDEARDSIVNACPHNVADFVAAWVKETMANVVKKVVNPKCVLREDTSLALFTTLVAEGGGIPFLLQQLWGIPSQVELEGQLTSQLTVAFAPFPNVPFKGSGKAKMQQDGGAHYGVPGQSVFGMATPGMPGVPGLVGMPGVPGFPGLDLSSILNRSAPY
jgi:hypothetical protein